MWEFEFKNREIKNVTFSGDSVLLNLGNELICSDLKRILWKRKMYVTFYRDPYDDVNITALDANQNYVAVGTNFMDGKVYLFTKEGKLLWMHQLATIASLGWRPEDVTALKISDQFVIVGSEFMNEYVYAYTINRKRIFQKKVKGRVLDFFLFKDKIAVGTENCLYIFNMQGKENCRLEMPTKKVEVVKNKIVVLNNYGIIVYKFNETKDGVRVEKYWSAKLHNSNFCIAGENILLASETLLNYISKNGEVIWQKILDSTISSMFYDNVSDKIYVGMDNKIQVFSNTGKLIEDYKINGRPLKIGWLKEDVVVVVKEDDKVKLYKMN